MVIGRKSLLVLMLAVALTGVAAWAVLLNPDNPFTRLFARDISDVNARVVIGPYPGDRDFRLLKANKVDLIVTLLDPAIPYEANLLEQEKGRAARFGIELRNFPMSSILGQKFGNYYDESATRAAEAIATSSGKVYLHCYLGMHRIQAVRDLLAKRNVESGTYTVRRGERGESRVLLDTAEAAYGAGRYSEALESLAKIPQADLTQQTRLLGAWCHYRSGQIVEARSAFTAVLQESPDNVAANSGLGYCALRDGGNDEARRRFSAALAKEPQNADALGGLGLAYYRADRLEEAERYLEASLKQAPSAEWQEILGRIRGKQPPVPPGAAR